MTRPDVIAGFQQTFGRNPALVTRAPGRVNLIGEHTDYNDGLVLPAAIGFATWTAIASPQQAPSIQSIPSIPPISSTPPRRLHVHAGNRGESVLIDLDQPGAPRQRHWSDYVRGIALELERDGFRIASADLWFAGDVPDGAGLSSSAALEMSVGLALLVQSGHPVDPARLAFAGQRAEHRFAGTQCGIMDQFISAHARAGHALLLDCRSLAFRHLPIPDALRIVICDSGVKHELAGGEYNARRAQCEEGVDALSYFLPGIRSLRDVTPAQFQEFRASLSHLVQRRCRHVIDEIARVEAFAMALEAGDLPALGRLMAASHDSLRDDYEVSCPELDTLVDLARSAPGVIGARMTGGGFGGSTVNLVEAAQVGAFTQHIIDGYRRITGRPTRVIATPPASGAAVVPA